MATFNTPDEQPKTTIMEFYQLNFAIFVVLNAVLAYREYRQTEVPQTEKESSARKLVASNDNKALLKSFKWRFLPIYLLVNGADWLQVGSPRDGFQGVSSDFNITGTIYLSSLQRYVFQHVLFWCFDTPSLGSAWISMTYYKFQLY